MENKCNSCKWESSCRYNDRNLKNCLKTREGVKRDHPKYYKQKE